MSDQFESLELRQMFSAVVNASVLRIIGTEGPDQIVVYLDASRRIVTRINGVVAGTFPGTAVRKIIVDARGGNDVVSVSSKISTPSLINAGKGDDVVTAGSGRDTIYGEDGADVLRGGDGDDQIDPGGGRNNIVDGGKGTDLISYATATADTDIDVMNQQAWQHNPTAADNVLLATLNSIENAEGGSGNDELYGSTKSTVLRGLGGNDRLVAAAKTPTALFGGDGDDRLVDAPGATNVLDGGRDYDYVSYSSHSQAVRVTLDGVANDGEPGENDSLRGCEGVYGTRYNDVITGDDQGNVLHGGDGNDTISGGGGDDLLWGDDDNDELHGGTGNDWLKGGYDNDVLADDSGSDIFDGEAGDDEIYAADGHADIIDGGAGNDKALVDGALFNPLTANRDTVTGVEDVREFLF